MPYEGKPGSGAKAGKEFNPQQEPGSHFAPEVKNAIRLTVAFTQAVGRQQKDKSDNLVVSPYNATAALSMVAKGAEGKTRDELAQALFATDGAGLDQAVSDYAALNEKLLKASQGKVELTTANGIWANQALVKLRAAFADDAKKTFGAEVSAENFGDPATLDKINAWASANTKGLIPKVLDELNSDTAAILASALYFKGEWTHKFDRAQTQDKTFTQDGGAVSVTPMMSQYFNGDKKISHLDGGDFEAVALTYGAEHAADGKGPAMRIVLVRPKDESLSAREWLDGQDKASVPAWLDPYAFEHGVSGKVELPRLDIKQNFDLIPALEDMGVKTAFKSSRPGTPGADFSRMVEAGGKNIYVSKVSHDTVFKTDEQGSEAAAVTVIGMRAGCAMPTRKPLDFKIDRSFAFALQDVETGAVLFLGAVNKPSADLKPAPKTRPGDRKPG